MDLDIRTAVQTAFFIALAGVLLSFFTGIRSIRAGHRLLFFRKRRDLMVRGWRWIFFAFILGVLALLVNNFAEPVAYSIFPPSPTITITPTITLTPTVTETATITLTPTITETPSITPTPSIPEDVAALFEATQIAAPQALFSPLVFAREVDEDGLPVSPLAEFVNPVGIVYGTFSFDMMVPGAQWTAIWYRMSDGAIVCFETRGWPGSTGGYGYTECEPASADMWQPGAYQVRLFVGRTWVVTGEFTVSGEPATSTPTTRPSATVSPTRTRTVTPTITRTSRPTSTARPTQTLTPTVTPTRTRQPTRTRVPPTPTITQTHTRQPTPTRTLTLTPSRVPPTRTSTHTPRPWPTLTDTRTPAPTSTQWPTRTQAPTSTRPRPTITP